VAAFRYTGWQHNFALGGSITLHWVAELIAFSSLIDAAEMPFHRILLMTLYATGARRAEVAHLKVQRHRQSTMFIHIRGGKDARTAM
jgi:site-specific recombinase XerD